MFYIETEIGIVEVQVGQNVADDLGILKYEPPIPTQMAGQVTAIGQQYLVKYDIENFKKFPDILDDGEEVYITEKLHGTCAIYGWAADLNHDELTEGTTVETRKNLFATSKGMGAQGLVMKDNEVNAGNLYLKAGKEKIFFSLLILVIALQNQGFTPKVVLLIGEIYGKGVQDLQYGAQTPEFRAFDIWVDNGDWSGYVSAPKFFELVEAYFIPTVPLLYKGPFSVEKINELRDGKTTVGGGNIREGVVIKPQMERNCDEIGRVVLKHISDKYLLRKNPTEFN